MKIGDYYTSLGREKRYGEPIEYKIVKIDCDDLLNVPYCVWGEPVDGIPPLKDEIDDDGYHGCHISNIVAFRESKQNKV